MPAARGYYHYYYVDHGGADINDHHCSCDHHNRPHHYYFFVNLDLYDHRAANDDLHAAGYDFVYNHHVALNDQHLDYHYPAPDNDHDHRGADIDHSRSYDHVFYGPDINDYNVIYHDDDDVHLHYDPDEYEYVDQHDDDLASR